MEKQKLQSVTALGCPAALALPWWGRTTVLLNGLGAAGDDIFSFFTLQLRRQFSCDSITNTEVISYYLLSICN